MYTIMKIFFETQQFPRTVTNTHHPGVQEQLAS